LNDFSSDSTDANAFETALEVMDSVLDTSACSQVFGHMGFIFSGVRTLAEQVPMFGGLVAVLFTAYDLYKEVKEENKEFLEWQQRLLKSSKSMHALIEEIQKLPPQSRTEKKKAFDKSVETWSKAFEVQLFGPHVKHCLPWCRDVHFAC
jgi:hypothetical protein